jgi:hypothetical protein
MMQSAEDKTPASHFFVRREPSLASFILNYQRTGLSMNRARQSKGRVGHASAPNSPEFCDIGPLRRYRSHAGFLAGIPGNPGTTNGLHARRLPALRSTDTRRQSDRRLFAAKCAAAQRTLPRGFRFKCQRTPGERTAASCAETAGYPIGDRVISQQTSTHSAATSSAIRDGAMRTALWIEPAAGTTSANAFSEISQ